MRGRLDVLINVQDLATGTNEKGPSLRHGSLFVHDAIGRCEFLTRITEDGIVELERLGEIAINLRCIAAGRKKGDIEIPQRLATLTERLALGCSA